MPLNAHTTAKRAVENETGFIRMCVRRPLAADSDAAQQAWYGY